VVSLLVSLAWTRHNC